MLENIPTLISDEENVELNKFIEEDEIINAILGLALDKAPGPDGFTIHFFKPVGI
jgi:hypothetical protein